MARLILHYLYWQSPRFNVWLGLAIWWRFGKLEFRYNVGYSIWDTSKLGFMFIKIVLDAVSFDLVQMWANNLRLARSYQYSTEFVDQGKMTFCFLENVFI